MRTKIVVGRLVMISVWFLRKNTAILLLSRRTRVTGRRELDPRVS